MTLDPGAQEDFFVGPPTHVRRKVSAVLAAAGVPNPQADAGWLVATVANTTPAELVSAEVLTEQQQRTLSAWVTRRAHREPLQHILGNAAFRYLSIEVGPGVFVPRPETEVLVGLAQTLLDGSGPASGERSKPRVVDLCSGSGAVALALATEREDTDVWAVELHEAARGWLARNIETHQALLRRAGSSVTLVAADATADPLPQFAGSIDLVTCNPPYIPDEAVPRDPEVARFDPTNALYGGPDGLDVVRGVIDSAARMLRPGGWLLIEHGDAQGWQDGGVPGLLVAHADFLDVRDEVDLAGRPRVAVARRL